MYNYPHLESIIEFDGSPDRFRVVKNLTTELEKICGVRKVLLKRVDTDNKGEEIVKRIPKGLVYKEVR